MKVNNRTIEQEAVTGKSKRFVAVLTALLVTFLWSTSYIIIKDGLNEIPPITFAGLRYFLASIALLPVVFKKAKNNEFKKIDRKSWKLLILLGLIFYAATQGIQFIGLSLISTVTVSLMLNFTPLIVVVLGVIFLNEKPNLVQISGIVIFITGVFLYFRPVMLFNDEKIGIIIMGFGVLANAASSVLGRRINMNKVLSPVIITFISMSIGALVLLVTGLIKDGFPDLSLRNFIFLIWLAVINTAFAFTLWNFSLRSLTAMESSIINGTMLIQIAILSMIFLDIEISFKTAVSIIVVAVGAILAQLNR